MGYQGKEFAERDEVVGLIQDFQDVFTQSPQGQRVLAHLNARFKYHHSELVDLFGRPTPAIDRETVLANAYQRSVMVYINGMINADTEEFGKQYDAQVQSMQRDDDDISVRSG